MSNRCESKCLSSIIDYPLIVSNKTYQLVTQSLPITYWWHSLPIYHTFNDLKPVHIATWNPGTLSFPLLLSRTKEKERSWVQGWSYCSCCCSCFLGYSKLAKGAISSHVLSILALSGSKAWVDFGLIETCHWGQHQNKVTASLASTQRQACWLNNCKLVFVHAKVQWYLHKSALHTLMYAIQTMDSKIVYLFV